MQQRAVLCDGARQRARTCPAHGELQGPATELAFHSSKNSLPTPSPADAACRRRIPTTAGCSHVAGGAGGRGCSKRPRCERSPAVLMDQVRRLRNVYISFVVAVCVWLERWPTAGALKRRCSPSPTCRARPALTACPSPPSAAPSAGTRWACGPERACWEGRPASLCWGRCWRLSCCGRPSCAAGEGGALLWP